MLKGIESLVAGAKAAKIRKFIHLSSIAIYGQDPAPDSVTEAGKPAPVDSYGRTKLRQDKAVLELHRSGIPSYLLVPGNISGPYSRFVWAYRTLDGRTDAAYRWRQVCVQSRSR